MDRDGSFHTAPNGASEAGAAVLSGPGDTLAAILPEGWLALGRCRFGTAGPGPQATGCHALVHPDIGVALLDIAPDATPNAEARLRRALSAAEFWPAFQGILPIWHGRIESTELAELGRLLQQGFASLPPLSVPGGPLWITAFRRALEQDPAWEIQGQATPPGTALMLADHVDPPPRQSRRRGPLLFLGFVASFWLGLAAGLVLVSEPEMIGRAPSPSAPAIAEAPPPALPPPPPPVQTVSAAAAAPPAMPAPMMAAAPDPFPEPLDEVVTNFTPALPPSEAAALADAPLATVPGPSTRPVARVVAHSSPRPVIDRACSQALFRFQQGEALTAAERVHLREGCATRR